MNSSILKWLALVTAPVAIFGGGFFSATEMSVGEISDRFFEDVLIIPSGYAFSIWGLIYLGILALAVVQVLPAADDNAAFRRARLPLIANMICNFSWIVTWQSLMFEVATVILVAQLATAIWLYYALRIPDEMAQTRLEAWIRVPIRIYVGWLTVATVVGISTLLYYLEWGGWGLSDVAWAAMLVVVATAIGVIATLVWRDPIYGAVFVWAWVALALRPEQEGAVATTGAAMAAVVAAVIAYDLWSRFRRGGVT